MKQQGRLIFIHAQAPKGEEEPLILGYSFNGVNYFGNDALARLEQDSGDNTGIVHCLYAKDLSDEELDLLIAELSQEE